MTSPLETTFTFRNIESTDALRMHALEKLERLHKYLVKPASAHIIFKVEGPRHEAEITLQHSGARLVGHDTSTDMYASFDGAIDKLKKQLSREKERMKGHKGE